MRKRWIAGLVALAVTLGATGMAVAWNGHRQIEIAYRNIQIYVDGERVQMDEEPFLHVAEGRTYVPARPLAEALGGAVSWDDARNAVIVQTPGYVQTEAIPVAEAVRYTVPARGVSVQLYQSYALDTRPGEVLGLTAADPQGEVHVSVQNLFRPRSVPLEERANDFLADLLEDIGAELMSFSRNGAVIDGDRGGAVVEYWLVGTARKADGIVYRFGVRLVEADAETWAVAAYGPGDWDARGTVESFVYAQ